MNAVVHFEIPADYQDRAKAFYSEAFGLQFQSGADMDYNFVMTADVGEDLVPVKRGCINGGLTSRAPGASGSVIVVGVDSVEDAMKAVLAAGGTETMAAQQVSEMGI